MHWKKPRNCLKWMVKVQEMCKEGMYRALLSAPTYVLPLTRNNTNSKIPLKYTNMPPISQKVLTKLVEGKQRQMHIIDNSRPFSA